jgi:hypothetical protein
MTVKEVTSLLRDLKKQIADDYRANEDDDCPGMCVTIATTDGESWGYQTGDNSYSGAAYSYKHWHTLALYRNSNCAALAADAVIDLRSLVAQ